MRLIQTDGEGNIVGEVKTFDPIAGVHDAVRVASQLGGDGTYWADSEDGKYYEFTVQNGQAHGLTEEGWRSGSPAEVVENADMAERIARPASEFGGFFQDPDANLDTPAVNFLMPDVSNAVAAREAAAAEDAALAAAQASAAEEEAPVEAPAEGEVPAEAPAEGEEAEAPVEDAEKAEAPAKKPEAAEGEETEEAPAEDAEGEEVEVPAEAPAPAAAAPKKPVNDFEAM